MPAVSQADTGITPGTPTLATIAGTSTNPAPWNEWQGDSAGYSGGTYSGTLLSSPFEIAGNNASVVNPAQVLPTYEPAAGSTAYPNVAVDQGAEDKNETKIGEDPFLANPGPYQSGQVGTPGPLAGYCGSGDFNAETGYGTSTMPAVSTQPAGETLPLGPAYFPHIVLNADGTLTGYFDYRPKDENEAVVAATSTDGGKTWTYDQEALQQDANYCASGDTNDDGQGHPNVLDFGGTTSAKDVTSGGTNDLFTLQRAAGDDDGVGMLVHNLSSAGATESDPLGTGAGALPSSQPTGVDPDTFATAATVVNAQGGLAVSIPVSTTGTPGTLTELVAGGFVDLGASGTASPSSVGAEDVITCTGVTESSAPSDTSLGTPTDPASGASGELTGCTSESSSPISISADDLIEQVIGYVSAQTPSSSNSPTEAQGTATAGSTAATFPITLPNGPNSSADEGGYAQIDVSPTTTDATVSAATTSDLGFTYELTGQQLNLNAPDRYYIDGTPAYCTQSNNNETNEIEDCTIPVGDTSPSIEVGAPIVADPIVPAGTEATTGLVSPDGIVGELHSFPTEGSFSIPSDATYVMYDEKKINYYVGGETNKDLCGVAEITTEKKSKENANCKSGKISTASGFPTAIPDVTFNPWEYFSQSFAPQITVTEVTGSSPSDAGQDESTFTLSGSTIHFTMGDESTGNYDDIQCTGVETVSTPEDPNADFGSTSAPSDVANPVVAGSGSLQSGADDAFTGCSITGDTPVVGAAGGTTSSFSTNTMIAAPGAALEQPNQLQQTGEGKANKGSDAGKLYSNNEDLSVLRVAWTTDGVNFYDAGLENSGIVSGSDTSSAASTTGSTGTCASDTSYTDLSNPNTVCNPENANGTVNLNLYSAAGTQDATEMRWPGSGGSIIYNPSTGEDELFLSGAWAGDGDSDAFNQVYYATSTNGLEWTVPKTVVSTDYSFSASEEQDAALAAGSDQPVGISAYYSGRAYGPAVVPNPEGGGFWMIFAGYNVPKGAGTAEDVLNPIGLAGTEPYVGPNQATAAAWTIGSGSNGDDPAMYRNILSDTIDTDTGATLAFTAPSGAVAGGTATLSATSTATGASGPPIVYSVDSSSGSGVCSVSGDTVTYTAGGTCVVDANQAAGDGYADAAQQATVTIDVTPTQTPASKQTPSSTPPPSKQTRSSTPPKQTKLKAKAGKVKHNKVTITVTKGGKADTGTVKVYEGRKLIATLKLKKGKVVFSLTKLKKGTDKLTLKIAGKSTTLKVKKK